MKKIIVIFLLISFCGFSQDEKIDIVPFTAIEEVPIFPGCNGDNLSRKKCMQNKMTKHILKKFNIKVAQRLDLSPGRKRISVQFKINKSGIVEDIRVRAPHPKLEKEAIRVIKLLPQMIPGKQKGKPVNVRYNLPITFNVEDAPISKSKRKARRKKNNGN
jgi:protein TonB